MTFHANAWAAIFTAVDRQTREDDEDAAACQRAVDLAERIGARLNAERAGVAAPRQKQPEDFAQLPATSTGVRS